MSGISRCSKAACWPRCRCGPASSAIPPAGSPPIGCCKRTGSARIGRRAVAIVGLLGCAVFIVPAALTEDPYTAVFCLTASMFFLECTIGPSWAVPMDTGGKYSGTVSGMMNMAGNFGGAISPIVFGYLAQGGNWEAPFIVAAALLVIGSAHMGVLARSG